MSKRSLKSVALFTLLLLAIGCSQTGIASGTVKPQNYVQSPKINDLLNNPDAYNGQNMVFAGEIDDVCPSEG